MSREELTDRLNVYVGELFEGLRNEGKKKISHRDYIMGILERAFKHEDIEGANHLIRLMLEELKSNGAVDTDLYKRLKGVHNLGIRGLSDLDRLICKMRDGKEDL